MEFLKRKQNVVLIALLYTFLWGCAFPLVKICMEQFSVTDNISKCLVRANGQGVFFTRFLLPLLPPPLRLLQWTQVRYLLPLPPLVDKQEPLLRLGSLR